jgi:hypothetical protein
MQWRTLPRFDCVVCGKSAHPPRLSVKADIPPLQLRANSRPEQVQQTKQAYDHLVGAREQRRWHGEAKGVGSLEVRISSTLVTCC